MHPLETRIRDKLAEALTPLSLTIEDESRLHAGHNPAASAGGTHYRVAIVSAAFAGLSRVARQRRVYELLADEIRDGVHALSLVTLAPGEPAR